MASSASAAADRIRRAPQPQEILILTAYTPDIANYGEISSANKDRYAREHGYAFRSVTKGFVPHRPPAWSKIHFIRTALGKYPWVFWSDADALVTNFAVRIESIISAGHDVFLTEAQCPIRHLNTGSMLFRRSLFSLLFLRAVWNLKVFTHDPTWEQRAVNHLCANYRLPRVRTSPNRHFNSYGHVENDPDPYQPGDFIIHFPGRPNKLELMRHYAATSQPIST